MADAEQPKITEDKMYDIDINNDTTASDNVTDKQPEVPETAVEDKKDNAEDDKIAVDDQKTDTVSSPVLFITSSASEVALHLPTSSDQEETAPSEQKPPAAIQPAAVVVDRPLPRAQTTRPVVEELRATQIRWFYKQSEADKKWRPFEGKDSLLLECRYRRQNGIPVDDVSAAMVAEGFHEDQIELVVLGGLYKFRADDFTITPIYYDGKSLQLHRGIWFIKSQDYEPLEDTNLCEQLEREHLKVFRGQRIPDKPLFVDKGKRPVITQLKLKEYEVTWHSVVDINLTRTSRTQKVLRYFHLSSGAEELARGYFEEANVDQGVSTEIDHLVFIVHGIGQKQDTQRIVRNTDGMRDIMEQLMSKYPCNETKDNTQRKPMLIPVEWRSVLELDGDLVDQITLPDFGGFRNSINCTAMDIMYYMSPLYRSEIVDKLSSVLNRLFEQFMSYHPSYNGKVTILAHSLGAVMTYDILTGYSPIPHYDNFVANTIDETLQGDESENSVMRELKEARDKMQTLASQLGDAGGDGGALGSLIRAKLPKLNFPVENLICLGSPLAVFMALRRLSPAQLPKLANLSRLYNVYHPLDPVAYRLEPLINQKFRHIAPLKIHHYYKAPRAPTYTPGAKCKQLPYAEMKPHLCEKSVADDKQLRGQLEGSLNRLLTMHQGDDGEWKTASKEHPIIIDSDHSGGSSPEPQRRKKMPQDDMPTSPSTTDENTAKTPGKSDTSGWFSRFRRRSTVPADKEASANSETNGNAAIGENESRGKKKRTAIDDHSVEAELGTEAISNGEAAIAAVVDEDDPLAVLYSDPDSQATLKRRLDFVMRTGRMELSYWSLFSSHFCYWANYDVVMFLLNVIYPPTTMAAAKKP